jgi:hypothetical protein
MPEDGILVFDKYVDNVVALVVKELHELVFAVM